MDLLFSYKASKQTQQGFLEIDVNKTTESIWNDLQQYVRHAYIFKLFDFTSFAVIVAKAIYLRLISMKLSRQLFDFTSFAEIITKAILISEIDTSRQS